LKEFLIREILRSRALNQGLWKASMTDQWRIIVVTSDRVTWENLSQTLSRLGFNPTWTATVEECSHIFRRDKIDLVFCDERVRDGDYWDVYGAISRGLIRKPKVVLISQFADSAECEQAKACGIFAVIQAPCQRASVEWTILLVKKSSEARPKPAPPETIPKFDIFAGAPEREAMWVCAVSGLANAKERMEQIALERPGRYFIFYSPDRTILAQTETFARPRFPRLRNQSA
jgi:CheY-like chemotaxis protein